MTATDAKRITIERIEDSDEFKYIIERIKKRAKLGYTYVKIDDDIEGMLKITSVKSYLEYIGYKVSNLIMVSFLPSGISSKSMLPSRP